MTAPTAWRPRARLQALRERARLQAEIRSFFAERAVLEVTPPVLARHTVTAPTIQSIEARARFLPAAEPLYLQTSPEYAMKRLLAAGSGPIYAITPAFRDGEFGRSHNPEFTLLEWYRPGFALADLMDEVTRLLECVLPPMPVARRTYREAFAAALGVDPLRATDAALAQGCREHGVTDAGGLSRDEMLDLLFSHAVQPHLGDGAVFVNDFPASQAACAQLSDTAEPVALRFELFVHGIELANAYQELCDAAEQARRFEADRHLRAQRALPVHAADDALLAALAAGLPPCSGVALGVDRLLMVRLGLDDVRDTLAFPYEPM